MTAGVIRGITENGEYVGQWTLRQAETFCTLVFSIRKQIDLKPKSLKRLKGSNAKEAHACTTVLR